MTGGRAIVLGPTGRNFAAGMSGGIAYVYDANGDFAQRCNQEMVELLPLSDPEEVEFVRSQISEHVRATQSTYAEHILTNFDDLIGRFVKVLPHDYAKFNEKLSEVKADGYEGDEAVLMAFELATGKAEAPIKVVEEKPVEKKEVKKAPAKKATASAKKAVSTKKTVSKKPASSTTRKGGKNNG